MKRERKYEKFEELNHQWHFRFKEWGEGLYYTCLQTEKNNLFSRLIGYFSYNLSHTTSILYCENPRDWMEESDYQILRKKIEDFYGCDVIDKIKVFCIASAGQDGIDYCSFSYYQNRKQCIRKIDALSGIQKNILSWFVKKYKYIYDYSLVLFWPFSRYLADDKKAYDCSEITAEGTRSFNIFICSSIILNLQ
jgi:hypothetical protein